MRPFASFWVRYRAPSWRRIPQPLDSPHATAPGPDPLRVLLIGYGVAMGYGVLTHDLSLAGHIARQLSSETGRGVQIDILTDPDMTAQGALRLVERVRLSDFDALVLAIGLNEAHRLSSLRAWRKKLTALLDYVDRKKPKGFVTILISVPPMQAITAFPEVLSQLANRHALALNEASHAVAALHCGVVYAPISRTIEERSDRSTPRHRNSYWTRHTYSHWANMIVSAVHQRSVTFPSRVPRVAPGTTGSVEVDASAPASPDADVT
ncbi:SGNH/GDSL hydrolase family protein [Glaciihabitans sp. dw_435]|uniref:SGNH/GDSL hydrolase family protein n=1 Tax=Glaciihabitans sp. dw_435 TaxID=2720081 RepID=UPI001BD6938E|nr:SGNH/GDSL hydrolase family protein [Glaciihabitans sp. dw_435]